MSAQSWLLGGVLLCVVVGTGWPAVLSLAGRDGASIQPKFFAVTCGVLALALLALLAVTPAVV